MHSIPGRRVILSLFLIFLLLPIYWLVNMSFKTNGEIVQYVFRAGLAGEFGLDQDKPD